MIMCIQNLVKFCPFILKIWSKNLILESIKGRNSVTNLPKFGLNRSIRFQDIEQKLNSDGQSRAVTLLQICRNLNSSKLSCMSSLPARMRLIKSKMKELECSQDFSHYKSMGIFPDAQGQLTPQSLV